MSIAVDDESNVTDKVADDLVVEPAVTQATPVEMVDEHAEPFTDGDDAETESVSSEGDLVKTGASGSADNPADTDEAREPVLNVDALEEVSDNTDIKAEAGSAVPEGEEKSEVRTTVH